MWNRFIEIATFRTCKLLARLFPPQPKPLPRQARLILVFSTTGLGDGLFDSAAIRSLKLGHPAAKLIVCAHRTRQSVALHNPCVDEVVPFGKSPFFQFRLLWRFRRDRPGVQRSLRKCSTEVKSHELAAVRVRFADWLD